MTRMRTDSWLPTDGEHPDAWRVLERLVQQMQRSERRPRHLALTLEAIRESLDADAVFLHAESGAGPSEIAGRRDLAREGCRESARRVFEDWRDADAGQLLWNEPGGIEPSAPGLTRLRGVAGVRLSRSRGEWIIALSLRPGRIFGPTDLNIMALARRLLLAWKRHAEVYDDLKETLFGLIRCLATTIDAKDPYTAGHSERVARIAVRLSEELGLSDAERSDLYLAGLLHDVGKIGIRDEVLQKPGRLSEEEKAHIREHPVIGDRIVSNIGKLAYLRPGVRSHHEWYDGRGYPDGLRGEAVPRIARILAVADSCDAMMSNRRYRLSLPPHQIEAIMSEGAGSQWDPAVVEAFQSCRAEVYEIGQRGLGRSVYRAVERVIAGGYGDSVALTAAVAP